MLMNTVIFSHGKESGPNGSKIQLLRGIAEKLGYRTISVDYRNCKDVTERVELLSGLLEKEKAVKVLVGSSMGGYVSVVCSGIFPVPSLFLMCPALYRSGYPVRDYPVNAETISVIHGWDDKIIPFENSIRFSEENKARLHLVADGHRLAASHQILGHLFLGFLQAQNKSD